MLKHFVINSGLKRYHSKLNRKLVLDFLNINTFDDKEIEKSFRKFALSNVNNSSDSSTSKINLQSSTTPGGNAFSAKPPTQQLLSVTREQLQLNIQAHIESEKANVRISAAEVMQVFPPTLETASSSTVSNMIKENTTVNSDSIVDYHYYREKIRTAGERLDDRIWTMAVSFLLTGSSIGVIVPCMPILVQTLHISPTSFGLIISAFGMAKLVGNIPAAFYTDIYGRKPVMIGGLGLVATGIGCLGLSMLPGVDPVLTIATCRFVTGLGVSAFTAGAFMMMADVSTPLNRTRTMAPVMTAFQAGLATGPAVGGIAIQYLGIPLTYASISGLFFTIALFNQAVLKETMPTLATTPTRTETFVEASANSVKSTNSNTHERSITSQHSSTSKTTPSNPTSTMVPSRNVVSSFSAAFRAWTELSKDRKLVNVTALNLCYWATLAGVQMTVLPLYMVSPQFLLSPENIGFSFALMSACSVLSSQPVAIMADKIGKVPSIVAGGLLVCGSFAALPVASSLPELWAVLVPLSIGSTALQSVPTAYVTDLTPPSKRAQALSMFRTAGDVGLLIGGACAGAMVNNLSFVPSILGNAGVMALSVGIFTARHYWMFRKSTAAPITVPPDAVK